MATDNAVANARPINPSDCAVLPTIDPVMKGTETTNSSTARISSTRYSAIGPNITVGVK